MGFFFGIDKIIHSQQFFIVYNHLKKKKNICVFDTSEFYL